MSSVANGNSLAPELRLLLALLRSALGAPSATAPDTSGPTPSQTKPITAAKTSVPAGVGGNMK